MSNIIRLPGLIDTHVHLREPGGEHKEDFGTGTKAAIAGGYTAIIDMPNNPEPIITSDALHNKIDLAKDRIYSDLGFHFGGSLLATTYFSQIRQSVFGLKVYMNHTTGPLLTEDKEELEVIFSKWPKDKVLMVHAEGDTLHKAVEIAKKYGNKLHACHVSLKEEIEFIKTLKEQDFPITCEVTAHHLFLTMQDSQRLGSYGIMRPPLGTQADLEALWKNLQVIDLIASDHAPHTKEEKEIGEKAPFGVPGLETTLPLLMDAVNAGRMDIQDIVRMCHDNPKRLFRIPEQEDTYVEVDPDYEWTISNGHIFSKCGWTPFDGMSVKGKILKVVLRGEEIYNGEQISTESKGKVIFPT
jgi:dihydroorotase-like cyclic amidohydrolase